MPIEIRELIIKATVAQEAQPGAGARPSSEGVNDTSPNAEMIQLSLDRIVELLKQKDER